MSNFRYGPNNIQTPVENDPNPPLPNPDVPHVNYFDPTVFSIPQTVFDNLVQAFGVRIMWKKSHFCPCTEANNGSPLPACQTCFGRGIYWDDMIGPFTVLLASAIASESQRAPGAATNTEFGLVQTTGPWVTVSPSNGKLYDELSVYDIIVEMDAVRRLNDTFTQGSGQPLSYALMAKIANVYYFDTSTNQSVRITNYSYDPSSGIVSSDMPEGTAFTVEYYAPYSYVVYGNVGGITHVRPLIQGRASYPKRVRTEYLDIWLRDIRGRPIVT